MKKRVDITPEIRETLLDAIAELQAAGKSTDEIVEVVVVLLDNLLPFQVILANPVGVVLEAVDRLVLRFLARGIVRLVEKHKKTKEQG